MPIPFKVAFEYRHGRRKLGLTAAQAMRRARLRHAFDVCPDVRLRTEPDPEPYEFGDAEDVDATQALIDSEGVWGLIGEVRCPCCGTWRHVDSVWGCVGESGGSVEWYSDDIMAACLKSASEQCQCADHELISSKADEAWRAQQNEVK